MTSLDGHITFPGDWQVPLLHVGLGITDELTCAAVIGAAWQDIEKSCHIRQYIKAVRYSVKNQAKFGHSAMIGME
jgi:hypothetical protein